MLRFCNCLLNKCVHAVITVFVPRDEFTTFSSFCFVFLTNAIGVIKPKSMRWVGHVVPVGGQTYGGLVWKPEGKIHLIDRGVDGRIILKCILRKQVDRAWTGLIYLKIGASGGLLWTWWRIFSFHEMGGGGDFLTSWRTVSFSRRTLLHGVPAQCAPVIG